jgi:15-cis-phytoene synthase
MDIFNKNALACSKSTTHKYSTSFSLGIKLISQPYRNAIYGIYGFVRFADEIVDTFHQHDKTLLLSEFKRDTFLAIERKISTNPILQSFQEVVNEYDIDHALIYAFFSSMEMDLRPLNYNDGLYREYIYGSAEVVGLMCLKVFYKHDNASYERLKHPARKLGEAFQKVNFLRDIQSDVVDRGRIYFPNIDMRHFTTTQKRLIEKEIDNDFNEAYRGIVQLKRAARLGVYVAYRYYLKLFEKIKLAQPREIMHRRFRVSNPTKLVLLLKGYLRHEANLV